ncbi:hypothetical protein HDU91_004468 [Kappamyces sp. JEL0680]|nr:hypothetical protein HDU91_004468 [Kappamyces sp. JEL0680]
MPEILARQGLLARRDEAESENGELVIDLSDEESVSECSESSQESVESNDDSSDEENIKARLEGRAGTRTQYRLEKKRPKNPAQQDEAGQTTQSHDWADDFDENPRYPSAAQRGEPKRLQLKKPANPHAAVKKYPENFRRNDNSSSIAMKWGHDLFEQIDLSDDDRERRQKAKKKKKIAKKVPLGKELKLKPKSLTPTLADKPDAPNWASIVRKETDPLSAPDLEKIPSHSTNPLSDSDKKSETTSLKSHDLQTAEKGLADLSLSNTPSASGDSEIQGAAPAAVAPAESARPRLVISQASKNQLLASFMRPGAISLRSALEKSTPVPRPESPIAPPPTASSNTAETVAPASVDSRTDAAKPLAGAKNDVPTVVKRDAKEKSLSKETGKEPPAPSIRDKEPQHREYLKENRGRDRELRQKEHTKEYHSRDRKGDRGETPYQHQHKDSSNDRQPAHAALPRNDLNARRNSQDVRENFTRPSYERDPYRSQPTPAGEPPREKFVIEKRLKKKSELPPNPPMSRRGNSSYAHPSSSEATPAEPASVADLQPKVVATSTGWALVNPAAAMSKPGTEPVPKDRKGNFDSQKVGKSYDSSLRAYKSKRSSSTVESTLSVPSAAALPYTPAVQPMITVQPMMTQSGHMVLLTEDGLCVPATPGMFQYQQWYDSSVQPPAPSVQAPPAQTYPTYYTQNYYASSEGKEK